VDEVEKPLDQYGTLNQFFSRHLKPGARPTDSPK
jgi:phosphatidylserine decarboxylase